MIKIKNIIPKAIVATIGVLLIFSIFKMMDAKNSVEEVSQPLELTPSETETTNANTSNQSIDESDVNKEESHDENENKIYLTFDDGPNTATPKILDTLKEYNAKATFFMLEPQMKQYPNLVKRIVQEGHAVGLHGVTHDKDKFYESEQSALDEMLQAQKTLYEISGVKSNLIRTPYGSIPYFTDSYRDLIDQHGFKLWDWNVDSQDWNTEDFVQNVATQIEGVKQNEQTPIIVMHDKEQTADNLSELLNFLSDKEFNTVKINESIKPYNFRCNDRCRRVNS